MSTHDHTRWVYQIPPVKRPTWRVKLSQWIRRFLHRTGLDL
jgi:hypothetical protein